MTSYQLRKTSRAHSDRPVCYYWRRAFPLVAITPQRNYNTDADRTSSRNTRVGSSSAAACRWLVLQRRSWHQTSFAAAAPCINELVQPSVCWRSLTAGRWLWHIGRCPTRHGAATAAVAAAIIVRRTSAEFCATHWLAARGVSTRKPLLHNAHINSPKALGIRVS